MRGFLEVSFVFFPKKETLWDLVCKKEMPCKDGLFRGGLLLPPNQALFIWLVSWLNLFIGIFGLYRNYPSLAFSPLFVFFTFLNYWRKPIYGWRRNVDMLSVVLGSLFATSRSFYSERKVLFWIFGFLGLWGSVVTVYLATFIKITIGRIHGFQLLPMRLYTCVGVYAIVYYFWIILNLNSFSLIFLYQNHFKNK